MQCRLAGQSDGHAGHTHAAGSMHTRCTAGRQAARQAPTHAHHQPRTCMPSMGEMLRDQVAGKVSPDTVFETQEQMLERYRQTL